MWTTFIFPTSTLNFYDIFHQQVHVFYKQISTEEIIGVHFVEINEMCVKYTIFIKFYPNQVFLMSNK